jgi:acyl-CoA synthetase (AMP-forming)/AMP-acid ligase II
MLYDRWCEVAGQRRNEFALADVTSGQRWTFRQLHDAGHRAQIPGALRNGPIVFPQGRSAGFILTLLAAWRNGLIVCPLEAGQVPVPVEAPPEWCVHLKSTSATGGASRLVAFTAAQLAADAENILFTMGLRPDWPNLGTISLAHSYGFSNLVLPLLLHGIPLILAPSPLPEVIRRAAAGWPALTLPAVPAMWRVWHESKSIPRCVNLAISAGAPLPVALEQAVFTSAELKLHNFYGSSECGGIAFDASTEPRTDDSLVGTPVQNVNLSVNDSGCLTVRSEAVGETCWPKPEGALGEGLFQTSDLAEIKDGLIYLRGRASDIINIAGRKVFPESIERVLNEHNAVKTSLVFGIPSPGERGEIMVACVESRRPVKADTLRKFLLQRLDAWQVPREWWFVDSLTANERGKLSRAEWREKFLARG